jgi:hypothetical protein
MAKVKVALRMITSSTQCIGVLYNTECPQKFPSKHAVCAIGPAPE